MLVQEPIKVIDDIQVTFAHALVSEDRETLLNILSDEGKYMIQSADLNTLEVDKLTYIDWILNKRKELQSLSFYFDQCTFCQIGNPVGIFNDGSFPKRPTEDSQKEKTGLMLVINRNKIENIIFCGSFIGTDNEWLFEKSCEKDITKYMQKKSLTREQAMAEIKANPLWLLELED